MLTELIPSVFWQTTGAANDDEILDQSWLELSHITLSLVAACANVCAAAAVHIVCQEENENPFDRVKWPNPRDTGQGSKDKDIAEKSEEFGSMEINLLITSHLT